VNVSPTTEIVSTDVEPAAAFPPFLITIVFFVKEATYRSGSGGGGVRRRRATIDQPKPAGCPRCRPHRGRANSETSAYRRRVPGARQGSCTPA
jgi:hypothetical protein